MLRVRDYNLASSIECGQIFTYKKLNNAYLIVHGSDYLIVRQNGNKLKVKSSLPRKRVLSILGLDVNFNEVRKVLARERLTREALRFLPGLRILQQHAFSCVISYVCSINSSIPRIKLMISKLARKFGEEMEIEGLSFHAFPRPKELAKASVAELRRCGLGFRASYVKNVARAFVSGLKEALEKAEG